MMQKQTTPPHRKTGHFVLLFSFMMVQLAVLPIFEQSLTLGIVGDLTYLVLVFHAVVSIRQGRAFWVSVLFFALTAISYGVFLFNQNSVAVMVVLNFVTCTFILTVIANIGIFVLKNDVVTLDSILGGLCVYILIGTLFTLLYLNIELLQPGSFNFGTHGKEIDLLQIYDLLFFYSFVSLLTIGYGDIVPMSHVAQTLSVLEGVIGQFYIVFCVAALVGLYLQGRQSGHRAD